MSEHKIPIPSMLYNAAVGGHVTNSQQIIDEVLNKEQSVLNVEQQELNKGILEEKEYTSGSNNGMGRVVLRKHLAEGVNTLTQSMINKSNTIYVIQYDFTLGEDITIPSNCILEFNGGSIVNISGANYTVTYDNTKLISPKYNNVVANGSIANTTLYPYYYGTNISESFTKCLYQANGIKTVIIDREYTLDGNVTVGNSSDTNNYISVIGLGQKSVINTNGYRFIGNHDVQSPGGITFFNIMFKGTGNESAGIFDCNSLIRLHFSKCWFLLIKRMLYANSNGAKLQSLRIEGCYGRGIDTLIYSLDDSYDINILNSVFEASKSILHIEGNINNIVIKDNCIEGISDYTIYIDGYIYKCTIDSNYFEACNNLLRFGNSSLICCSFINNFIAPTITYKDTPIIGLSSNNSIDSSSVLKVSRNVISDETLNTPFYYNGELTTANYVIDSNNRYSRTGLSFSLVGQYTKIKPLEDIYTIFVIFTNIGYSNQVFLPLSNLTPILNGNCTIVDVEELGVATNNFEIKNISNIGFNIRCKTPSILSKIENKLVKFNIEYK